MVANTSHKFASRCASSGATTMKCDCGVIAMHDLRVHQCSRIFPKPLELQGEIDQPLLVPIDFAEVQMRLDLTDFITNPVRQERSLGVVQDDALLTIEPTWPFVHLGDDGVESKRQDPVFESPFLGIEDFALPRKMADELSDILSIGRARGNDRGALPLAIRNISWRAVGKKLIQLRLWHREQL